MTFEEFKNKAKSTGIPFDIFSNCSNFVGAYFAELTKKTRYIGLSCKVDGSCIAVREGLPWKGETSIHFFDSFEQVKEEYTAREE